MIGASRVCSNMTCWKLLLHAGIDSHTAITLNMNKQWKEGKQRRLSLSKICFCVFFFFFISDFIRFIEKHKCRAKAADLLWNWIDFGKNKSCCSWTWHQCQCCKQTMGKPCFCCLINLDLAESAVAISAPPQSSQHCFLLFFLNCILTHHPRHGPSNLRFYPIGRCYQLPNLGFIWSPCWLRKTVLQFLALSCAPLVSGENVSLLNC